jgi:hypothetical protein
MFPFESIVEVLMKYVHNRACPEGKIAKGYRTKEVIDFIYDLDMIGVSESQHEGRLSGKGTLGKKAYIGKEDDYFPKAHYTILQNSSLVDLYIEVHKEIVLSKFPRRTEAWITRRHMETFNGWLQKRCQGDESLDEQQYLLFREPSWHILIFKGYEINGNTFYTIAQDKRSTNQNSGVRIDVTDRNRNKETYYGHIEEICKQTTRQWTGGGVTRDNQYGMTTVDLKNLGYTDKLFVLAKDVNQVFYLKDTSTKPKKGKNNDNDSSNEPKHHVVLLEKRNIVGIEDMSDMSEDYEKNDRIPLFTVNIDPSVLLSNEDTPWLRYGHNQET